VHIAASQKAARYDQGFVRSSRFVLGDENGYHSDDKEDNKTNNYKHKIHTFSP